MSIRRALISSILVVFVSGCIGQSFDPRIPINERMKSFSEHRENDIFGSYYMSLILGHSVIYRNALIRIGYSDIASETLANYYFYNTLIGDKNDGKDVEELVKITKQKFEEISVMYNMTGDIEFLNKHFLGITYCMLQPEILLNTAKAAPLFQKFAEQNIFFTDTDVFEKVKIASGGKSLIDPDFILTDKLKSDYTKIFNDILDLRLIKANEIYNDMIIKTGIGECATADYDTYSKMVPYLPFSDLFSELEKIKIQQ